MRNMADDGHNDLVVASTIALSALNDPQWRIQRGQGAMPPYKPMSGRRTSCSRKRDKRTMVSSHEKLNVGNA